jgi:hypothetical protein
LEPRTAVLRLGAAVLFAVVGLGLVESVVQSYRTTNVAKQAANQAAKQQRRKEDRAAEQAGDRAAA